MSTIKELVSVIIPTYNRASLVKRAIESVQSQTYHNIEVIVVDDGSKDNTEEILKSIKDERLKYIKHNRNYGPAKARNTGIFISKGEYIAFLDSDDEFLPQKLEKQIGLFKKDNKVGVVYCDSYVSNGSNIVYQKMSRLKGYVYRDIWSTNIHLPTIVVKKDVFEISGYFDETLDKWKVGEDTDMIIRLSKVCNFDFVPEALVIVDRSKLASRLTSYYKGILKARVYIYKKHKDEILRTFGKENLEFKFARLYWNAYDEGYRMTAAKICIDAFLITKNLKHLLKIPFILTNTYKYYMNIRYVGKMKEMKY